MTREELEYNRGYRYGYERGNLNGYKLRKSEEKPCEDAISREELKKWLDMNFSFGGAARKLEFFDRLDKELPPVTSTQRWIPVSERLPKDGEIVLITSSDMYLSRLNPWCGWVNGNNWYTFTANGSYLIKYPIAWMPLPKPYKAEMEGEE